MVQRRRKRRASRGASVFVMARNEVRIKSLFLARKTKVARAKSQNSTLNRFHLQQSTRVDQMNIRQVIRA